MTKKPRIIHQVFKQMVNSSILNYYSNLEPFSIDIERVLKKRKQKALEIAIGKAIYFKPVKIKDSMEDLHLRIS